MLKRSEPRQMKMAFVTLDELMPETHFLRDLDRLVTSTHLPEGRLLIRLC